MQYLHFHASIESNYLLLHGWTPNHKFTIKTFQEAVFQRFSKNHITVCYKEKIITLWQSS